VVKALVLSAGMLVFAQAPTARAAGYSFTTSGEFVSTCDSLAQPEECRNALMYVEQVVDSSDHPNDTCDGGPEALLKARSNEELEAWLGQRVTQVVAWLRQRPAYAGQSYGDGVWAALKGVYCR
jgi:hypothetical protein